MASIRLDEVVATDLKSQMMLFNGITIADSDAKSDVALPGMVKLIATPDDAKTDASNTSMIVHRFLVFRFPKLKERIVTKESELFISIDCSAKLLTLFALALYDKEECKPCSYNAKAKVGKAADDGNYIKKNKLSVKEALLLMDLANNCGMASLVSRLHRSLRSLVCDVGSPVVETMKELLEMRHQLVGEIKTSASEAHQIGKCGSQESCMLRKTFIGKVIVKMIQAAKMETVLSFEQLTSRPDLCWDSDLARSTKDGKQMPKIEVCKYHHGYAHIGLSDWDMDAAEDYEDYDCRFSDSKSYCQLPQEVIDQVNRETEETINIYGEMVKLLGMELISYHAHYKMTKGNKEAMLSSYQ
jgi:hypothetical protein